MSTFDGREALAWLLFVCLLAVVLVRGARWLVGRYGRNTRWGRRARTRQSLHRTRDGLLERYARGELTEEQYRERLRILDQEGRAGP